MNFFIIDLIKDWAWKISLIMGHLSTYIETIFSEKDNKDIVEEIVSEP
jgi:hypothetical protein